MNPEKKLQAKIVEEFSLAYPERRGRLFATFQETVNVIQGTIWVALGLVKNISDLIYIDDDKLIIGIEIKAPGTRHNSKHVIGQCHWLMNIPKRGYFCTSVEMFFKIIDGGEGILPQSVLDRTNGHKTVGF